MIEEENKTEEVAKEQVEANETAEVAEVAEAAPVAAAVADEQTAGPEAAAVEEAAAAEAVAEEVAEVPTDVEVQVEKVDYQAFRGTLAAYYDGLLKLIRITKAKDETIAKLTKEVQTFREDFALKLVKPMCVSLISLREDYRKTMREIDSYAKSKEDVIKYSEYVLSDVEDLLLNQNVELNGGRFYLKGEPLIDKQPRKATFVKPEYEPAPVEPVAVPEEGVPSFDALLAYIDARNGELKAALAANEAADANLKAYVTAVESIEDNYSDAVLLPLYRSLASMYSQIEGQCAEVKETITDENKVGKYASVLQLALDSIDKILLSAGVTVITEISDVFESTKDKLQKVVPCDDESKDRKIAKRHTDCYLFNGKVLYPSKVDVYKFSK